MMARSLPWLALVVCALAGAAIWFYRQSPRVSASPPAAAQAIVQKAWTDGRQVALEGRQTVLTRNAQGEPVEVEARVLTSSSGAIRIEYLTAPIRGVTVWDNGERIYRYNPRLKQLTVTRKDAGDSPDRPDLRLLENYSPQIVGEERVAGRAAAVVELRPRAGQGRWKRLWIDRETGFVLGTEDHLAENGVVQRTRYTEVRYLEKDPAPEQFRPSPALLKEHASSGADDSGLRFEPATLSRRVGFRIREPEWLPAGYTFAGAYPTRCACGTRHGAARLEFTDGLNMISLFQCGHPECSADGDCFAESRRPSLAVRFEKNGVSYLAVGDAPRAELERVIRSAAEG